MADQFQEQNTLDEAKAWCSRAKKRDSNPASSLRKITLTPDEQQILSSIGDASPSDIQQLVSSVVKRRSDLLKSTFQDERLSLLERLISRVMPKRAPAKDGRLLLYFPQKSGAEELAHSSTSGFFDVWDCPPWDTWVKYVVCADTTNHYHCLICWIPADFSHDPYVDVCDALTPLGALEWAESEHVKMGYIPQSWIVSQ